MLASIINLVKEEILLVGTFNFVMTSQCLKEMILHLPALPGPISIKMNILHLVRINMVWLLNTISHWITLVASNLNLTFKKHQISFSQMVTLIHGAEEVSTKVFHRRFITSQLKMQLTILIFSQKILPMDPMLKEFVNKSKLSSPGGKMITGISEIEDQIESLQIFIIF